jgi:hypothetical protein
VPDTISRHTALNTIEEQLAPLIGASMARSSVKLHSEKLGLDGTEIERSQFDALLSQIGLAMRVFVGAEKADALVEQITKTLFSGGR